ncbi:hypothetical protein Dsin_031686 [Dipteronia sinensis]|uniref:Uncharacterized protein n=1 Tax=Dipteronia sinensis TaxID=43782 RepID=A0AAE0DTL7_9ROSI|nr:hypothetical protein Dsin_031686 [Dipteronia sinensis]
MYGLSPDHIDSMNGTQINYKDELVQEFGGSKEFINSASQALRRKTDCPTNLSNSLEAAYQVADCDYESNTDGVKSFKLIGLSDTVFEVSQKDHESSSSARDGDNNSNDGGFSFDESSMFIPGTTMVLVQLMALAAGLLGLQPPQADDDHGTGGSGLGEFMFSVCGFMLLAFC